MTDAILVTGGNRGLGFEVVKQLAAQGKIVVMGARSPESADRCLDVLGRLGYRNVCSTIVDVSDPGSIELCVEDLLRRFDGVSGLVNNAGVCLDGGGSFDLQLGTALKLDWEVLEGTFRVNTLGPALLCRLLVPHMVVRDYGRVVNVVSSMALPRQMAEGWYAYRASKAALHTLTAVLAKEMQGRNILVNSVCPGWMPTRMGGESAPDSIECGAESVVRLLDLPLGGPTGKFFVKSEQVEF